MTDFEILKENSNAGNFTSSPIEEEYFNTRNPSIIEIDKGDKVQSYLADNPNNFQIVNKSFEELDIQDLFFEMDDYINQDNLFEKEMQFVEDLSFKSNYSRTELIREIISFKSLDQSWDGYNALPLEVEGAINAIQLIDFIGEKSLKKLQEIFPNPNGTVSFKWENEYGVTISLEVGNKSMSYYLEVEEGKPEFFNQIFINQEEGEKLAEIIERYF